MSRINFNDQEVQQYILNEIIPNWRFGIQPSGDLARSPYIFQQYHPNFSEIKHLKEKRIKIISDTNWTQNLIKAGIYDERDGVTMNSLSVTRSLFKSKEMKSQYQIEYKAFVFIDISSPESITDEVNKKVVAVMNQYNSRKDYKLAWKSIRSLFEEYGFLWPEGITLGYKQLTHLVNRSARETFDEEPNSVDLFRDLVTNDSIEKLTIIKRKGLKPIYEFMPPDLKKFILNTFKHQMQGLRLEAPVRWDQKFKLKNIHSNRYLKRHEYVNEEYEPSLCSDHSDDHCIWSFRKPTFYHRKLSEVLKGSEDVFLCSPKFQESDIEHLVITSEGPENDSCGIQHVHLSMDFHERANTWVIEPVSLKKPKYIDANESLDAIISNFECILNGDEIQLKQSEVYLCSNESMFSSFFNKSIAVGNSVKAFKRVFRDEKLAIYKKKRELQTYKSCVLPPKTNDKDCTHSAHRCASQLMVKKISFPSHTECSWKIEVINDKTNQSADQSDHSELSDTTRDSQSIALPPDEPNRGNHPQANIVQSNLDSSSQLDSILAIKSQQDQHSHKNYKPSESSILQIDNSGSGSGSGSEDTDETQHYAEKHLRKESNSVLHSRSNSASSLSGDYIDEGTYTQEQFAEENNSIKTQKKRKRLLLRLGKKNMKKNTLITFLKKATLASFIPNVSKSPFKNSKSNKSST